MVFRFTIWPQDVSNSIENIIFKIIFNLKMGSNRIFFVLFIILTKYAVKVNKMHIIIRFVPLTSYNKRESVNNSESLATFFVNSVFLFSFA